MKYIIFSILLTGILSCNSVNNIISEENIQSDNFVINISDKIEEIIFSEEEIEIINLLLNIFNKDNEILLIKKNTEISFQSDSEIEFLYREFELQSIYKYLMELNQIDEYLLQSFIKNNSYRSIINPETIFIGHYFWFEDYVNELFMELFYENYESVFHEEIKHYISGNINRFAKERIENYKGTISFSRIGFNDLKTEAMLVFNTKFGSFGTGDIIHLRKDNNTWKVTNSILLWMS